MAASGLFHFFTQSVKAVVTDMRLFARSKFFGAVVTDMRLFARSKFFGVLVHKKNLGLI